MDANEVADRLELRKLVDSYAVFVDAPDPEAFAALFLPNGRLISRRPDNSQWIRQGTEDLKTKPLPFADPPLFSKTFHLVATHLCEIAGDQATGSTYCLAHHLIGEADRTEVHVSHLRYDDEYTRTKAGWRFRSRTLTQLWSEIRPAGRISAGEAASQAKTRSHSG